MNISAVSTTQIVIVIAVAVLVVAGIAIWLFIQKHRTERLRSRFGGAEYDLSLAIIQNGRDSLHHLVLLQTSIGVIHPVCTVI